MAVLSKQAYIFWRSLPETKAVQEAVLEMVNEQRIILARKMGEFHPPGTYASTAAMLNGIETAVNFDSLFDFTPEVNNAEDGGA